MASGKKGSIGGGTGRGGGRSGFGGRVGLASRMRVGSARFERVRGR